MASFGALIVLGGSSEIATELVDISIENFDLILVGYRSPANIRVVQERFAGQVLDGKLLFQRIDLRCSSDIKKFFETVDFTAYKKCSFVICASNSIRREELTDSLEVEIRETLEVNLVAPVLCVREFVECRKGCEARDDSIVILSSEAAKYGGNRISSYAAAKGGVNSFVKGMAKELASAGTRINAVSPSFVQLKRHRPEFIAEQAKLFPCGRPVQPAEVAEAISLLLMPGSGYLTGEVISINGGR